MFVSLAYSVTTHEIRKLYGTPRVTREDLGFETINGQISYGTFDALRGRTSTLTEKQMIKRLRAHEHWPYPRGAGDMRYVSQEAYAWLAARGIHREPCAEAIPPSWGYVGYRKQERATGAASEAELDRLAAQSRDADRLGIPMPPKPRPRLSALVGGARPPEMDPRQTWFARMQAVAADWCRQAFWGERG